MTGPEGCSIICTSAPLAAATVTGQRSRSIAESRGRSLAQTALAWAPRDPRYGQAAERRRTIHDSGG